MRRALAHSLQVDGKRRHATNEHSLAQLVFVYIGKCMCVCMWVCVGTKFDCLVATEEFTLAARSKFGGNARHFATRPDTPRFATAASFIRFHSQKRKM